MPDQTPQPTTTSASTPTDAPAPWPLVTVIMPTRGRLELVRESIAAVVAQDYPGEIELFVVHDQEPTEPSLEELGGPGRTVRTVNNVLTPGLPGARNTGLDLASGEFIASCDDDDIWHTDKLTKQIQLLLDRPDLLVVGSGFRLRLPGGRIADWPARAEQIDYQLLLRNRVKELHSSTLVMRKDAFAKAGRYDEELPRGYAEDYDWVLRAARVGKIGAVTEPLADIRKDVQSWYQGRAENTVVGLEVFLSKHPEIRTSARGHARMLGQIGFARSVAGERGAGLKLGTRSLLRWPASPYGYLAVAHAATGVDPKHILRGARVFRRGLP